MAVIAAAADDGGAKSTVRTGMSVLSKSNTAESNTVLSKWPGMAEESAQSVPTEWQ